jgi:filamentous hemagglutinin family protein
MPSCRSSLASWAINLAYHRQFALSCLMLASGLLSLARPASAQLGAIVPDSTLRSTIVSPDGANFTINGGTQTGRNLFHSFQEFSIPTGGSATFANPLDVQTIFARVTGGNLSKIDGRLQTQGMSNLFLLNPAGIVFGPGATLNIGGSFVGTTATAIQFADGLTFPAAATTGVPPLLTMSVPIGLQFGTNSGAITVQGPGHSVSGKTQSTDRSPLTGTSDLTQGLTIGADKTLALVGNGISLTGGILNAPQGNVQLGSVQSGTVGLVASPQGWQLDYQGVPQFQDIQLSQKAIVDASGLGGSQVKIAGQNVVLQDGSIVLMQNQGTQASGPIEINAADTLRIDGQDTSQKIQSGIHRQQLGTGQGGPTTINAGNITLLNGSGIVAKTFSTANNGDLTINATDNINVLGYAPKNRGVSSEILSYALNRGQSGNLSLAAKNLSIMDGGLVGIGTFSSGAANDVQVRVRELVNVAGEEPEKGQFSVLLAISFGPGAAGNIDLAAKNLLIQSGGRVSVSALADGNAGRLVANVADTITVSGRSAKTNQPSFLNSAATILPPSLRLIYGTPAFPTANAGSVTLNTDRLIVTNGALVTVRNLGVGDAGKLMINANRIDLTYGGGVAASTQVGNGGNLDINVRDLIFMRDRGSITAEAKGTGNGGNLLLSAPVIVGVDNSDIIAKAQRGNGGNIEIVTNTLLGLTRRSTLTPESDITASSEFGVSGQIKIDGPQVAPSQAMIQLPTELLDAHQKIGDRCASNQMDKFTITGRGGLPDDPSRSINQPAWKDLRPIDSSNTPSHTTAMYQANMTTAPLITAPLITTPLVEAIGVTQRSDGQIELIARSSTIATEQGITCALNPASH